MKKKLLPLVFILVILSCQKPDLGTYRPSEIDWNYSWGYGGYMGTIRPTLPVSKKILIDASRDGGGWWYPQTGTFDWQLAHQGFAMANYLRNLGFTVDELLPGTEITAALLSQYVHVVRAGCSSNYSSSELTAYQNFLSRPSSLLLFQDHLSNAANDDLSALLHLNFQGSYTGVLTNCGLHFITTNAGPNIMCNAGSYIPDPSSDTTLYPLFKIPNSENCVMGVVKSPVSRIFFSGDINYLESYPTPQLMKNLKAWLYD